MEFISLILDKSTAEQVKDHLQSICNSDNCNGDKLRARGNYTSFKLGVPYQMAECVLNEMNWATNIYVKLWKRFFRSRTEAKGKK